MWCVRTATVSEESKEEGKKILQILIHSRACVTQSKCISMKLQFSTTLARPSSTTFFSNFSRMVVVVTSTFTLVTVCGLLGSVFNKFHLKSVSKNVSHRKIFRTVMLSLILKNSQTTRKETRPDTRLIAQNKTFG